MHLRMRNDLTRSNSFLNEWGTEEFEERFLDVSISPRDLWMIAAPPALLSRSVLQELIEQRRRVGTDYVERGLAGSVIRLSNCLTALVDRRSILVDLRLPSRLALGPSSSASHLRREYFECWRWKQ